MPLKESRYPDDWLRMAEKDLSLLRGLKRKCVDVATIPLSEGIKSAISVC